MDVRKSCNRIVWVTQVPHIDDWILVVIIGDHKLQWNLRVPKHLGFFGGRHGGLLFVLIKVAQVWHALTRLHKLENWLWLLQVPNNNFSIFACTCQNMWDNSIPADRCNSMTFMEVWLTRLELCWLLDILRDILYEDFRASTSEQVLLVWVELDRLDGSTLVDLGSWDTPSAHLQLLRVIF